MWSKINPIVKAFIMSEGFFWSAWNFIIPIYSVFVVNSLPGGSIKTAAFGFTLYLLMRVITELLVSYYLKLTSDKTRMMTDMCGIAMLSVCYLVIAFFPSLFTFFAFFIVAGISFGISSPAKYSMFALNLTRSQASRTWGTYDAVIFTGMGIATSLGGIIASMYGFKTLFIIASIVNICGVVPYLLYHKDHDDHKHFTGE